MKYPDHITDAADRRAYEEAMRAARGLPAHVVSRIANRLHRGIDYSGCSKGHTFGSMIRSGGTRHSWWTTLIERLQAEPRPPTRKEREAAKKAAAEKEREERLREAEGWTIEMVEERLEAVAAEKRPLREKLTKLKEEQQRLRRIGKTLSPRWAFESFLA